MHIKVIHILSFPTLVTTFNETQYTMSVTVYILLKHILTFKIYSVEEYRNS